MGISFSINEDLGALWDLVQGDKDLITNHLLTVYTQIPPCPGFSGNPKAISECQVSQVLSFMEFALGDQPYFFLRKGRKTFGLYRKTRNYFYDPTVHLCHRIGFEFQRFATKEEEEGFRLGAVPVTLKMVKAQIPVEPPAPEPTLAEVMASLAKVRSAVATLAADLDTGFSRFHKSLE